MFYYFAGGLFSHKDIIGNHLLAQAIEKRSNGKWQAKLPQLAENQTRHDPLAIRDNDFAMLFESDAAIFNFDGGELDSGTVAEFMAARFLDLPCVLFRSDFRAAGDHNADNEPWNLMLSGYPRTTIYRFHCMKRYQEIFRSNPHDAAMELYYNEIADGIIAKLDTACALPPVLDRDGEADAARTILAKVCGGSLPQRFAAK